MPLGLISEDKFCHNKQLGSRDIRSWVVVLRVRACACMRVCARNERGMLIFKII